MCWVGNAMTRRFVSSKLRRPQIIHSLPTLARTLARWRARRERIGLVPTMGALHAGHLALVKRAQRRSDRVIVSIFVNPTQFAPTEDLKTYPRTFDADIAALARVGADLVWAPSAETMYPRGFATRVVPEGPATVGLEDAFRPHFFAGVATVVATPMATIRKFRLCLNGPKTRTAKIGQSLRGPQAGGHRSAFEAYNRIETARC